LNGIELVAAEDGGWQVARMAVDVTETAANEDGGATVESKTAFGIITSQTCDIAATGPGARHPSVQVSPLIRLDQLGTSRANAIRQKSSVEMILVEVPGEAGEWAADLRISMPVSKSYLVGRTPVRGFSSVKDAMEFSERVAAKIRRPALHDGISGHLVDSLRAFLRRIRGGSPDWLDRIEQFRVRIKEGEPLYPKSVEIIVVTLDEPLRGEEAAPLRQWRYGERGPFTKACEGATLLPLRFLPLETISVRDYRESHFLRIPELGQRTFW